MNQPKLKQFFHKDGPAGESVRGFSIKEGRVSPSHAVQTYGRNALTGRLQHLPELDGIRGLAAVAVVLYHIALYSREHAHGLMLAFLNLCLFGNFGVDVFFALSGFLITRILLKERSSSHFYRNFYARRVLRLAPPYLLVLILIAFFIPWSRGFLLLSLFYLANFSALFHVAAAYGPLWSLSVEEHFYMVWPWVVRSLSRVWLAAIALAVCFCTPVLRLYEAFHGGFNAVFSWYRFDGLAWGALLAVLLATPAKSRRLCTRIFGMVTLAGLCLGIAAAKWYQLGAKDQAFALFYSSFPMLTACLIGMAVQYKLRVLAPLRSRVLCFFGDISYWLYLVHLLILEKAIALFQHVFPGFVRSGGLALWSTLTTVVLVWSILSGIAVRQWIEKPALRMKAKF